MTRTKFFCALLGMLVGIMGLIGVSQALAQKKEAQEVPSRLLFAEKAYLLQPHIDVVRLMTDDQKTALLEAHSQTLGAPALNELREKALRIKQDPNNPENIAALEKLETELDRARDEMRRRAGQVLNNEQQATLRAVNEAVETAIPKVLNQDQKNALSAIPTKK